MMKQPSVPMVAGLLGGIVMLVTVGVLFKPAGRDAPGLARPPAPARAPAPVAGSISPAVYRVASQFICTCGACGGEPLETCQCPTAVEERGFIQQQLTSGRTEAEAAEALQARYAGRKEVKDATPLLTDTQTAERLNQGMAGTGHLATAADRDHIISHFRCPCNECDMDELRECECPHPNGAQEVKKFIDDSIAARQHTAGAIVALVEQRYGGRIR